MRFSKDRDLLGRKKGWRLFEGRGITRLVLIRLAIAMFLVLGATACKHNKHATTTVQARAMFDFTCPTDELTLRVVDTEGARKMATQIAAYGCGKKAVYAYAPDSDTWLINGAVSEMPSDFEVPANVTKGKDRKRVDKQANKAEKRGKMNPTSAKTAPAETAPAETAPAETAPVEPAPE